MLYLYCSVIKIQYFTNNGIVFLFVSSQLVIGEPSSDNEAPCSFYIKDIKVRCSFFV